MRHLKYAHSNAEPTATLQIKAECRRKLMNLKDLLGEQYKDGMTIDEINAAIAGKKFADLSTGDYVAKGKLTDAQKRYEDLEAKYTAKLSDDEKTAKAAAEREEYYKSLEKQLTLAKYKSELTKTIKDDEIVGRIANLLADGKVVEAMQEQTAYNIKEREDIRNAVKAQLLAENPIPTPPKTNTTHKTIRDYTMSELNKMKIENPTEYSRILNE